MDYSDDFLRAIFVRTKTIAVVGLSANIARPSHGVAQFMVAHGFRVIGVNPGLAGQTMFGEMVYPDLQSIPDEVDMVDIFRKSVNVPSVVVAALARWPLLPTIWMQIGVQHDEAAASARARGVDVVQNRCPKIEYKRLIGASPKPRHI
tara:strand:+ start:33207 stop:33650 length:444 start_codon:yes stop_codon:yes gene_type:complete